MAEQLPLDFTASVSIRNRRARNHLDEQPTLFASFVPNVDIHLHSPNEAIAQISGADPERVHHWIGAIAGNVRVIKSRRVAFPTAALDRLLYVRPPAQVTLDANSTAVARALWAAKLGLKPLRVTRDRQRLVASSPRWPAGFNVKDVAWPAIATIVHLGVPVDVDPRARTLMNRKLAEAGATIATAGLAGTAVVIETSRPELVEHMGLPALAYAGEPRTGRYKVPLLAAEPLLHEKTIDLSPDLQAAIRAVSSAPPKFQPPSGFPWTLYPFQARDAAAGVRILETTGGVLLAGDMGSGKTTISLAMVAKLDLWPLLVVAPLSAMSTWARQLAEMDKNYYLAAEAPAKSWKAIEEGEHDAVVISYDRLHAFNELIERMHFSSCIADELQRIRTPNSRRSRALRSLSHAIPMRIGLSGTPLTNTVHDVLPLGAWLVPGEWNPRANDKDLEDLYPGEPVESLAEHLGTIMVRRRMQDTGATLPRRNDHRVYVQLTAEQRRALAELEAEAQEAKESGDLEQQGKLHAFVRLQRMRQIINSPSAAGVPGPNPKVVAAVDLAEDFLAQDRKGVIFCADRTTFRELGATLDDRGIGWVGIWGSTPMAERIANEKRFHNDPETKIVLCTIQAGSESWSASPTATWLISTAYVYAPSTLSQMECRVYRMSSDPNGPDIEICYIHAQAPGGSLDDRMVEIIETKKQLFAQVVDRAAHEDTTKVHYSMGDLVYLLTGTRDASWDRQDADSKAAIAREQAKKEHAKRTLYAKKGRNKTSADNVHDDGSYATLLDGDLDELVTRADLDDSGIGYLGSVDDEPEPFEPAD